MARFRPMLNHAGVTEQQWRVLRALLEHEPMEPRAIVEVCRISSPSLAGVLARMDELGLVSRKRIDHDQRRVLVSLTVKSRTLARRLAPRISAIYDSIEESAGAKFIEQLYASLDELIASLRNTAAQAAAQRQRTRR